jgi:hypothetical protein
VTVSISDKWQFGQKNKEGANCWVVLHDKGLKPYQVSLIASASDCRQLTHGLKHRFVATTLLSTGGELAAKLAQNLDYAAISGIGESVLKAAFGEYLHNF